MLIFISLLISLVIFLYTFYYYTRDDFEFIKKGISIEVLYNVLFIGLFVGSVSSRLVYLLLNSYPQSISSTQLHLISKINGISIFGGLLGLFLTYLILTKQRKIPRIRFIDYVSVALSAAFPLIFLGAVANIYLFIMHTILFIFYLYILLPRYINGRLKVGSLSLIFLIMVSLVFSMQDILLLYTKSILLSKESFLFFGLFFASCLMLVRLERKKSVKLS